MAKFLLGVITGVILIVLIGVLGVFSVAAIKSRPPSIAEGSTLVIHLSGEIPEKAPVEFPIPFFEQKTKTTVEDMWAMLRRAGSDPRIRAVVLEPDGIELGWAKMQEIRADIEKFRKTGKPIYAFLRAPSTREYYLASACDRIYLNPTDQLNVKGVGLELMYFRNTLDKLGVQVEVEHAGKYKDYGDMFTRTSMSAETKEVLGSIADEIYNDLIATIAKGRKKDEATVKAIIDDGPFLGHQAKEKGLVDVLGYEDQMLSDLKTALKQNELKKVPEREYLSVTDAKAGLAAGDRIAWVVAEGSITRGDPESASAENGIESEYFVKLLKKVGEDAGVKAAVVRINSPGGEVTASDDLWRAMNELRKKKPVVISMSDAAASGGYYMAMSGDPIVAYPATETGSIGVVFGKPVLKGLYDKVGVSKDFISRGRFALIDSDYATLDDAGRKKLREGIDSDYHDFVSHVATARGKKFEDIAPVAEGRVWLGSQAKDKALVDEIGGIDRAIEIAKRKAGIPVTANVSLVVYPAKRSIWDVMFGTSNPDAQIDAMLGRTGLEPLRAAWKDDRLRVWMKGGMLRMMPFEIRFF